MGGGKDHAVQILLQVENCNRWNRAEIKWGPVRPSIGGPENTDVGRSQHGLGGGVVAIDQHSQYRDVGQSIGGWRSQQVRIAVGLSPRTAEVSGHENMADAGRRCETRET
jgi:hypothetical protein